MSSSKVLPKDRSLSRVVANLPVLDKMAKALLLSRLKELKYGSLVIRDQDEVHLFGEASDIRVTIHVHRSCFYSRTVFGGSIGNAESYVDGDWECSQLTNLIRLFVKNRELTQKLDGSLVNLFSPAQKIFHGLRHNSVKGSRENIRSHYDMGNDFFKLFLDETMMYSSAVFANSSTPLKEASLSKIKLVCEKLDLRPEHHILEIGTGWGSLAIFVAQNYGCKVTTTTISTEQYRYTLARVRELGLENKVEVLFEDYRKLTGQYDRLVSIEMIEAVGLDHLETYFASCSQLLKPEGLMVLQAITIRDQFYQSAKDSVDFIQRHIFPGSGIPSVHAMLNAITKKTDLALTAQQDFAEDYAQTLKHWNDRFLSKQAEVLALGYPDFIIRLWQFYFAYCEGGFRERAIGLSQMTLAKPAYRNRSLV